MSRPRKPCDGTANDYVRHCRHGEEPCQASRRAWAAALRRYRRTGLYALNLPYQPSDEEHIYPVTPEAAAAGEHMRAAKKRKREERERA